MKSNFVKIEYCAICGKPVVFEGPVEILVSDGKKIVHEYEICCECGRHVCVQCCSEYDNSEEMICSDCLKNK